MRPQSTALPLILAQNDAPPASSVPAAPGPVPGAPAAPGVPGDGITIAPGGQPPARPAPQPGIEQYLIPIVLGLMVFFLFTKGGPGRKERKIREDMLKNLKKGDRVQTIGGEIGSVVEVREKDVLLKVDENNNTRIRYARDAIREVIIEKPDAPAIETK